MVSAYSIGQAKRSEPGIKGFTPAPNTYLPKLPPKQSAPQWTIGGAAKRVFRSSSIGPGPGSYGYQQKIIEGPQYTMIGRHSQKQVSQSPGPGNYNDESYISIYKKLPNYSLGARHRTSSMDLLPGPGQYDLNTSTISNQSIKFPTQPRLTSLEGVLSPGPGQYQIDKAAKIALEKSQPSWIIGTSQRSNEANTKIQSPGPGAYQLKSLLNLTRNFTLKSRIPQKNINSTSPGPGTYEQNFQTLKNHNPTFKIGTEIRNTKDSYTLEPGPGQYFKDSIDKLNSLHKSVPQFKMPKAERKDLNDSITITPGPGQYLIKKQNEMPYVSMKGSSYNPNLSQFIPGPGQYNPDDSICKPKEGSYKIVSNSKSKQQLTSYIPGPGQYGIKSSLEGPQWKFSKEIRSTLGKKEWSPGPGAYDIPPKFNDVPKYLLPKQI